MLFINLLGQFLTSITIVGEWQENVLIKILSCQQGKKKDFNRVIFVGFVVNYLILLIIK